jgi:hypothetical protein
VTRGTDVFDEVTKGCDSLVRIPLLAGPAASEFDADPGALMLQRRGNRIRRSAFHTAMSSALSITRTG